MGYGLSIDVGTSFTAAAVIRADDGQRAPRVLALGTRAAAVPTVVFLGEDGSRLVGEAAERRGLSQPEYVTREFKRRLGDDVPLMVGGTEILPQELLAAVVTWVVGVATEREGGSPDVVTLTHPAGWGEHRTSLLRQALSDAGVGNVVLMTEPEAAALSYASREHVPGGSTLAVYDLGGGTFDATVLRKTDADTFTVLGTPQGLERLGGADFDQEIFNRVLASAKIPLGDLDPPPEVLAALHRLRRECAEAKEALSSDSEATVSVLLPGAHSQVRLVRSEFEAMIEPALGETIDTLRSALGSAQVDAEDLTAILLIGGSSRIPLVAQLLSEEFDRPLAIDLDPKASVALGAAFATAALEDVPDQGTEAAPGLPDAVPAPGGLRGSGVLPPHTGPAGSTLPFRKQVSVPLHGPAALTPHRRIGIRIGAIAAAVALLGVATATATNAPNPLAAISALTGDQPAEAAQEPGPVPGADSTATPTGEGAVGSVGSVPSPDGGRDFLERARDAGSAGADRAGSAEGTSSPSPDDPSSPDGPSRSTSRASGVLDRGEAASDESPIGRPDDATPAPSEAAAGPAEKPGTTPVDPTPPVPFPSSAPTPTPAAPSPVPVPTPEPTAPEPTAPEPTAPEPTAPEPTAPPVPTTDPPPADAGPPTGPASEPAPADGAPISADPPSSDPVPIGPPAAQEL